MNGDPEAACDARMYFARGAVRLVVVIVATVHACEDPNLLLAWIVAGIGVATILVDAHGYMALQTKRLELAHDEKRKTEQNTQVALLRMLDLVEKGSQDSGSLIRIDASVDDIIAYLKEMSPESDRL